MTETKHTPGPWSVALDQHGNWAVAIVSDSPEVEGKRKFIAKWRPQDHGDLATIFMGEPSPDYSSEALANANLIAAAPDLLAAAKIVLDGLNARIEAASEGTVPVFDGIADLAAAIAKAEGRE